MPEVLAQEENNMERSKSLILQYEGEDDRSFFVSDPQGTQVVIHKNRSDPKMVGDFPAKHLRPAFLLLALASFGLAPAGLGTLIFAPLAALWAGIIAITHPLRRSDRIRVIVIIGISAVMLGIAIPISNMVLAYFQFRVK